MKNSLVSVLKATSRTTPLIKEATTKLSKEEKFYERLHDGMEAGKLAIESYHTLNAKIDNSSNHPIQYIQPVRINPVAAEMAKSFMGRPNGYNSMSDELTSAIHGYQNNESNRSL